MRASCRICILQTILILASVIGGFSQNNVTDRLVFSVEPRCGFVMPHHDHIAYFLNENISGFQANIAISANGTKDWHRRYNYPLMGVGFYRSGLGNDEIFGKLNGYYAFVDYKIFPVTSRWNIGNRISFGLSYNSKCFDAQTNPRNFVVGTHFNAFFQYDLALHYSITPQTSVKLSGGLTHSSNGNLREPNSGFNIFTASVGLQYYLRNFTSFKVEKPTIFADSTKNALLIGGFLGTKTYSVEDNNLYMAYGVMFEYEHRIGHSGLVGVELTAYRDELMKKEFYVEKGSDATFKNFYYYRFTVNPTYLVQMGRIYIAIQPGIYLNFNLLPQGVLSHKLGLRYQLNNNMLASIAVKTHYFANSDFIEFSFRYKFDITN